MGESMAAKIRTLIPFFGIVTSMTVAAVLISPYMPF